MSELIPALLTGGIGAALGGIGTALIQSISGKGISRAEAADRVTNAAGNLADRLDKEIARRDKEIAHMRKALSALSAAIEDLLPMVENEAVRLKAQKAVHEALVDLR